MIRFPESLARFFAAPSDAPGEAPSASLDAIVRGVDTHNLKAFGTLTSLLHKAQAQTPPAEDSFDDARQAAVGLFAEGYKQARVALQEATRTPELQRIAQLALRRLDHHRLRARQLLEQGLQEVEQAKRGQAEPPKE